MTESPIKIEVSIRLTQRVGSYDTKTLAEAKVEDSAPWPITSALSGVLDDATERIDRQIKLEARKRREVEVEVEA